ncbi:MAG: hypothetical protein DMD83_24175 [Candidatus Rokuibacteriota bacterium]|nr:MAG: hypothetical protein DMD83_24175 [Candidatus Rokubacteria bacterium]
MHTMSNTSDRPMELNLAHVRTLQAVVSHGSFSRAAERLHLSQPAVSLHIRHLEQGAGLRLLERVGKRAFPTTAGEILLEHAGRALGELEAAHQALERLRGVVAGRLRLGTGATASTYLLPPLLRRLHARHPALELVVVTGNSAEVVAAGGGNQRDLAARVRAAARGVSSLRRPTRRHRALRPRVAGATVDHGHRDGKPPPHPLRARRDHPARDRRVVAPEPRRAAGGHGAGQCGGDQEARGGRSRSLGQLRHGRQGRGPGGDAGGVPSRSTAVSATRHRAAPGQAPEPRARGAALGAGQARRRPRASRSGPAAGRRRLLKVHGVPAPF